MTPTTPTLSSSPGSRGTNVIKVPAYFDGTNAPVVFNIATTYAP